jgi:putative tryptophan/tyrosine transport system substrate-binding protein
MRMIDPLAGLRSQVVALAAEYSLPMIYPFREDAVAGGLISYGTSLPDQYRQAALFVHKIFKGALPADLPVEQPTKYELVVNLKTSKALGLTISHEFMLRADELVE